MTGHDESEPAVTIVRNHWSRGSGIPTLGMARSNVHLKADRSDGWIEGRTAWLRDPVADMMLIDAVRAEIVSLPTYGYRRVDALVNRTRGLISILPVNHKRFYRVMKGHCLLLPKAPKRRVSSRPHDDRPRLNLALLEVLAHRQRVFLTANYSISIVVYLDLPRPPDDADW